MPHILLNKFSGISPRVSKHLLAQQQAQLALNTRLWSGALQAFDGLGAAPVALDKVSGDTLAIYLYGNGTKWLSWTQDVNLVRGAVSNDTLEKTYFTGTDKPRLITNDTYQAGVRGTNRPPDSVILGLPNPDGVPVAVDVGPGNIAATSTWMFTYIRKFSDGTVDESGPSAASNVLGPLASRQVQVSMPNGSMANPSDYGITHKWLYRRDSANFFFVGEFPFSTTSTIDSTATANLGIANTSTFYLPPPDGMVGIIAMPNGCTAGFQNNVIYISEPYKPHAYPLRNQYTVSHPVVAIGNVGTAIVVGTPSYPWVGRGVDPAQYSFKPSPAKLPCVSKRSMASSELGAFYASEMGIAGFDGSNVTEISRDFITRKEWQRDFAPSTIHATVYDGRYMGWFQTGTAPDGTRTGAGFVIDKGEQAYMVMLDEYVYATHLTFSKDDLWLAKRNLAQGNSNFVYQWEGDPTTPKIYTWKSREFMPKGRDNYAFAQIIADFGAGLSQAQIAAIQAQIAAVIAANAALAETTGYVGGGTAGYAIGDSGAIGDDNETQLAPTFGATSGVVAFTYWADGTLVFNTPVWSDLPFALPAGFMAERHEIQLQGAVRVEQVILATSMEELAERTNSLGQPIA